MIFAMRGGAAPGLVFRLLGLHLLFLRAVATVVVLFALPAAVFAQDGPLVFPDTQYEPVEWGELEGWASDDHAAAFAAFLGSCRTLQNRRRQSARDLTPIPVALKDICDDARQAIPLDEEGARRFFEDHFRPIRINRLGDTDGFLTGYYEPIIAGSRVPTGEFTGPLYRRPPNLVPAGRRKLGDAFPSKGVFVGRRVGRRKIVPYYDRGQIEDGALDGWHLEICYLHDQVDVLFAQIQGSARIRLEDGAVLRVNYDSHNGWPYTPVGRVLVDQKMLSREQVSMQSIRDWMEANADQAKEVRRQNKSYVFFRITDLATEDEAVGGQGVPLMPGRSIAIDRALHAYGTPFFIQAELPIANQKTGTKFDRLMIAQDTGSAIVGPARADIYFGAGDEAARIAGRIKNPGTFVMLVPRALDPVAAGSDVPLPPSLPGLFSFNFDNMPDPTAPDGAANEVPLPETKPAMAAGANAAPSANGKSNARRRR
jgi:peptidoglycan lytic transglycosylase A